jgi:hypothetical protein
MIGISFGSRQHSPSKMPISDWTVGFCFLATSQLSQAHSLKLLGEKGNWPERRRITEEEEKISI